MIYSYISLYSIYTQAQYWSCIELIKDVHLSREEKFRPPDDHVHKLHA